MQFFPILVAVKPASQACKKMVRKEHLWSSVWRESKYECERVPVLLILSRFVVQNAFTVMLLHHPHVIGAHERLS